MGIESEILEVKRLIGNLRATDTEFRVFGSSSHRYGIGDVLPEAEILKVEHEHGVTLPEDYRLYLQLVGDGNGRPPRPNSLSHFGITNGPWHEAGAGPGYGIYPFSRVVFGDVVNQPFPLEEELDQNSEPSSYGEWYYGVPGALEICTHGCASHTHLVVNGPTVGTIWDGHEHIVFSPTEKTFIQWMREWAERALRILANESLVDRLAVGMTKEQVMVAVDADWEERANTVSLERYFEAPEMPFQLILSKEDGIVAEIKPWSFIA